MKSSQVTEVEKKVQEVYRFRRQDQMHSFEEYMGFVNQMSESLAPTIKRMSPIVRDVAAGTRRPSRRAYRPAHKFSEELNALTEEGIIPTEVAKSLLDARSETRLAFRFVRPARYVHPRTARRQAGSPLKTRALQSLRRCCNDT
jgi:hypothetical protein